MESGRRYKKMKELIKKVLNPIRKNTLVWGFRETLRKEYYGYAEFYERAKDIVPGVNKYRNFFKWFYTLIRYGASAEEYFLYEFYKKSMYEINTYVTRRRRYWFMKQLNEGTYREPVEDKVLFAKIFPEFTKRKILDGNTIKEEDFFEVMNVEGVGKKWIVKPREGWDGQDIFTFEASADKEAVKKLYDRIYGKDYVIEEFVRQGGAIHELNPQTVNTIRVNVLHWEDEIFVVNAFLRIGNGEHCVDNFHAGGMGAAIDIESGVVICKAIDLCMKQYIFHPVTQRQIIGIKIPRWNEVMETAKTAALKISDVPYTSWDIMASDDEVLIIEGNTYGDTVIQQMSDKIGKWKIYKAFTDKVIMERKRLKKQGDGKFKN